MSCSSAALTKGQATTTKKSRAGNSKLRLVSRRLICSKSQTRQPFHLIPGVDPREEQSAISQLNICCPKNKTPHSESWRGFEGVNSLTMTYFHTGIRTIIGAGSFHCPVRDGKEWDQVAMVVRLDWLAC